MYQVQRSCMQHAKESTTATSPSQEQVKASVALVGRGSSNTTCIPFAVMHVI